MPRVLLCLLLLLSSNYLLAQKKASLSGTVVEENQETLIGATVVLLHPKDSAFVEYSLTSETGTFQLQGQRDSSYLLQISFLGYAPYEQQITLLGDSSLGTIALQAGTTLFDSIMVTAEHIPIQMRGDTLAFNSAAFNVRAHDDVEALLKQLPGVEIQDDGKITINGKVVTEILVDSKEFFGDNAQAVLKALPADAIKKIEVVSAQKNKDGEDNVNDEQTIDLKLKEEAKTGWLGNVEGAYGHNVLPKPVENHRYKGRFSINHFNEKMRITLYSGINNINESALAFDANNINNSTASGINRAIATGLNVNTFFSEKTDLNLSYLYRNNQRTTSQTGFQQSILEENYYTKNSSNENVNSRQGHTLSLRFRHKFDKYQTLRISTRLNYGNGKDQRTRQEETVGIGDSLQNTIHQDYKSSHHNWNISPNLYFKKEFEQKKGRIFSSRVSFNYVNNSNLLDNNSLSNFYGDSGQLTAIDTLQQEQYGQQEEFGYNTYFTWEEPIGKGNDLAFELYFGGRNSQKDQSAFDLVEQDKVANDALTDSYQKFLDHQEFKTTFKRKTEKYLFKLRLGIRRSGLRGNIASNPIPIIQEYYYPTANMRFRYLFSKNKKITLTYNLRFQEPRIEQLQPLVNNQDPLAVSIGNPNLIPEYWHTINLRVDLYQLSSFTNFYASLTANLVQNAIIRSQTLDANFRTTYQPVNSHLSYRGGSYLGLNTVLKNILKIDLRAGLSFYQSGILVNEVLANQFNHDYNGRLTLSNKKKKVVDLSLIAKVTVGNSIYESNAEQNVTYVDHAYAANIRITIAKKWNIRSKFDYKIYANAGFGSAFAIPIWSLSVNRTFLKNDALKLELSAENLLNEAVLINRSSRDGLLISNETNLLGRYLMLSLTYQIKA